MHASVASSAGLDTGTAVAAAQRDGESLACEVRSYFEPRFGQDFSGVRVHSGQEASDGARAVQARAYTVGQDIVFGPGEYAPSSREGRRLLAHELVHTLQQSGTELSGRIQRTESAEIPAAESSTTNPAATSPALPADPDALAADISALLHEPDPTGGMRTAEAIQRLQGLDLTGLLPVLRALRARAGADLLIIQDEASLLISVAAETVRLEVATGTEPEVLARYRSRVQQLSQADQAVVIATYPLAATPAEPIAPAGGLVPPPGAPTGLPSSLLETLYLSYARRQAGFPGSDNYLANAFWSGRPTDFWQALVQMGPALDVIRRIYARWTATTVPWTFVDALYDAWTGTSDGFNFACHDRSGLESALMGSSSFCEDHIGGLYHWWKEGTTPCWREIISGSPGLHVCTGGGRTTVHIDAHQIVGWKWPGGFCSYDISGSLLDHFKDLGWW
jgi:hypothetical protein